MKHPPLLAHFREYTTQQGRSLTVVHKQMTAVTYMLNRFTFDEVINGLNDIDFERSVKTAFRAEYSELYSLVLMTGVRRFFIFLRSFETLEGLDLSELKKRQLLVQFKQHLFQRGYDRGYISNLCVGVNRLIEQYHLDELMKHIGCEKFEVSFIKESKTSLNKRRAAYRICGLRRFREFLVEEAGLVVTWSHLKVYQTKFSEFVSDLEQYIIVERNYDPSWVRRHLRVFEIFEGYLNKHSISKLSKIDEMTVLDFLQNVKLGASYTSIFRNILKLMYRNDYNSKDLTFLVLRARKAPNRSRKYISPEEVERILLWLPDENIPQKRDKAMFYLFARLGLRTRETARLKLSGIDWVNGQIHIQGKSDKGSYLPLPQDAGDILLDYLSSSNRSSSDYVFLSSRPPYGQYRRPDKIIKKLKQAYLETGIICPTPKTRLNVFRHSLATKELNNGNTMMNVRDLLRHDNVKTTMVYAKYNIENLRGFAMPWPEAIS